MEYSVYGCKVNKFYLNRRLAAFAQRGFADTNAHIMATCVVTDTAKQKRLKDAKSILREWKKLYLTWCGAFEKGEAMDYEKFYTIYPSLKTWREHIVLLGEDPKGQTDAIEAATYDLNTEIDLDVVQNMRLFTKKFIVIQSGCDTFCTFCLTIYKRGSQRNRTAQEIIDEINHFTDQGGKEIVITWVNLASRWASHTRKPQESRFSDLLEQILTKTTIERIRISSLWPEFLDDKFFEVVSDTRFLPHFHISIQSFATPVLQLMNRNYDEILLDRVLRRIRQLPRADAERISIGADLIVGFPGETEADFQKTLDGIKSYGITKVHGFPFSAHVKWESVPAWKLPGQLPIAIKQERMERLLACADEVRQAFLAKNKWHTRPVLVEEQKKGIHSWWTPNYIQVTLPQDSTWQRGDIVEMIM